MQLQKDSPTNNARPRWRLTTSSSVAHFDPVDPVTTQTTTEKWSVVNAASGIIHIGRSISDLFSISQQAAGMLVSVYGRLRQTRLVHVSPAAWHAKLAVKRPVLSNPVEEAKARWRTRALMESKFIGHLLASSTDIEGRPAPPAGEDDDV